MKNSLEPLFSKKECFIGGIVVAFFVVAAGYFSLLREHAIEQAQTKKDAQGYIQNFNDTINEVAGVRASLATLYRVTNEFGSDELDLYTEELVGTLESIKSIGRYDHIKSADIDSFASLMTERGIYQFELKALNIDGSTYPAGAREYHDAVVSISPFNPRAARLIGVDLTREQSLTDAVSEAVEFDKAVLTGYPPGWPQVADSLLFIPTYAGRYIPKTADSRATQQDGGYFVELSFQRFLRQSNIFTTEIRLPGTTLKRSAFADVGEPRVLPGLFSGYKAEIHPVIGNTEVGLTVRSQDGVSKASLLHAALWMFAALLLSLIAIAFIVRDRRSNLHRRNAQKSLEQERQIALTTLEAINDSVFTLSPDGEISYVNPAGETMVQQDADELLGMNVKAAIPVALSGAGKNAIDEIESSLEEGCATVLKEIELQTDNAVTQVDCAFTPFIGNEDTDGGVLVMRDVGQERALTKKLEHLATHDSLTGLFNRYYFELELEEMVKGATERGEIHAVCYIDLDQFKIVNDTCGHQAGDKLLVQITNHLKSNCRSTDVLARLGGDEFGLLIKNCDEKECEAIAQRLHDTFQSFYFVSGERTFAIRACFGFVAINRAYDHVSDILAAADIACYSAKDRGRNEMFVFRPGCEETTQRQGELNILPKLQNALSVNNFVLFVQPIAEILPNGTNDVAKYEILLRMRDDDGSLITPYCLIKAAERYDLMKEIDRWVIKQAFRYIAELQVLYGDQMPMFSINLSGQSVMDQDLIGYIRSKVSETNVQTNRICFEITETAAMSDMTQALELLEFLHSVGSKVALDDFGAGECSFGYLKNLPVDYLKIDGQFVKDIDTCQVHKEMIIFVQKVANLLDMQTVAEFVENESILNCLRELDIDYAQGYHISKPFNITELKEQFVIQKAA